MMLLHKSICLTRTLVLCYFKFAFNDTDASFDMISPINQTCDMHYSL